MVTGTGTIDGRPVCVMANDPTVKAGSWGPKTVEKILRIQEKALAHRVPMVYLVDSAGALQWVRQIGTAESRDTSAAP